MNAIGQKRTPSTIAVENEISFQLSNASLITLREQYENIRVVNCPGNRSNLCAIYFSSNALYAPNTEEAIRKALFENDRYEWTKNLICNAKRHIFVRDVYKQWYLEGVNSACDTVEKTLSLLKKHLEGCASCVCVGSSAGGFAAVLFGSLLGAERILAFNPQFTLSPFLEDKDCPFLNPILWRNKNNGSVKRYYDLKDIVKAHDRPIYYFVSARSEKDLIQYHYIRECGSVKTIFFNTSNHGIPFLRPVFRYVLNADNRELDQFVGMNYNSLSYSFKYGGLIPCLKFLASKASRFNNLQSVFLQWLNRTR